jgi:hypothetical protein
LRGNIEKIVTPIRILAIAVLMALASQIGGLTGPAFAAASPPPFEDHYVDANGQHLHYVTTGKGPHGAVPAWL